MQVNVSLGKSSHYWIRKHYIYQRRWYKYTRYLRIAINDQRKENVVLMCRTLVAMVRFCLIQATNGTAKDGCIEDGNSPLLL